MLLTQPLRCRAPVSVSLPPSASSSSASSTGLYKSTSLFKQSRPRLSAAQRRVLRTSCVSWRTARLLAPPILTTATPAITTAFATTTTTFTSTTSSTPPCLTLFPCTSTPTSPSSSSSTSSTTLSQSSIPLLSSIPILSISHTPSPILPVMATQTRSHSHGGGGHHHGHGHGHHHHHHNPQDNVYLTSSNTFDAGVRITRLGLVANLAMAIGKFIGGYMFHSQALIADAYHALTDLVSDFLTLGTVAWSLKPPSERFPNGYGKVESIGALGVSGLLLCGGVFMGLNAGQVLLDQFYPSAADAIAHSGVLGHGHSHSHGIEVLGPSIHAAWLAGGSIIIKEWLYRATMRIAEERKSSVLASNAIHHRIDSLTSIVALFTIGGTYVFNDASWLDPVGGLLISLMVIKAGWGNTKTSLLELADTAVDEDIRDSTRNAATKALADYHEGSVEVRDIQGMKSGQNYLMEVELAVPGDWSVSRSREIEKLVREAIGANVLGVKRLKIRFVPREVPQVDFSEEFIAPEISARNPDKEDHDHHSHGDSCRKNQ